MQALKKRDLQSEEQMSQICSMELIKLLPQEGLIDFYTICIIFIIALMIKNQ